MAGNVPAERAGVNSHFDSEQRLGWRGRMPTLDEMERLHWRTVARWGLGAARVRRDEESVTVALLGRVPLLRFEHVDDRMEGGEVERVWRIVGGATTRGPGGTFSLGARREGETTRAWVRVAGMRSRLAGLPLLGRLYAGYHALVSESYLRALRASGTARPA